MLKWFTWDNDNHSKKASISPLLAEDQDRAQASRSLGVEAQMYSALKQTNKQTQLKQCSIWVGELLEHPCNICLFKELSGIF